MAAQPGMRAAVRALRLRNFRLFWIGAMVSNTGTWIQILAVPFVIEEITNRGAWVGFVAFMQMLPAVALGPLAGPLADRIPRRTIILVCQSLLCIGAFGFGLLWAVGVRSVIVYMLLALVYGMLNGIMLPAWQAFISELVPRDLLLNAITLNSTQFQATRAMGPAIGGVVLTLAGPGWAFFANGLSFAAVLVALALIRVPRVLPENPPPIRIGQMLGETFRYVNAKQGIRRAFLTVLITSLIAQPLIHLIVVFGKDVFGAGGWELGLLASSLGIGSVLLFPLVAGWGQFQARSRLMAVALSCYGVAVVGFGLSPWYGLAIVFLLAMGGSHLTTASTLNTVIQLQVDEHMRGRVLAMYLMEINLGIGVGTFIQGVLFDVIGPPTTVMLGGIIMVVLAAWLVVTRRFLTMDEGIPTG